jgi:hypothetical protein
MLKLSCSYDSVRFILLKYELNGLQTVTFCVIFQFLTMFNTIVVAGDALHYGFGSCCDQMLLLLLRLRNTLEQ